MRPARLIPRATVVKLIIVLCCMGYIFIAWTTVAKKSTHLRTHRFTVWTNDFHISPIFDIKHQLSSFDVEFIDKSLSGACYVTKSCAHNLQVFHQGNAMLPSEAVRDAFYNAYKDETEMNRVNIFMCFHPAAMCEVFMPFNRTMIVIATTRYDLARHRKVEWHIWNENLQLIAANPRNVVAANNRYDAEYIRYFTGLRPLILPSLCTYTNASYAPDTHKPFLLAPIHGQFFPMEFRTNLSQTLRRLKLPISVSYLREVYKERYEYSQLAEHPGVIYVPYQVSLMSLFEQYRMNIPLFFPSLDLLSEWHLKYRVVRERTWGGVFENLQNASLIPSALSEKMPDPNNEFDLHAIRYWLQFSDFYQWPYITYFHSIDDLAMKLNNTNLTEISQQMQYYNAYVTNNLHKQWRHILDRIN